MFPVRKQHFLQPSSLQKQLLFYAAKKGAHLPMSTFLKLLDYDRDRFLKAGGTVEMRFQIHHISMESRQWKTLGEHGILVPSLARFRVTNAYTAAILENIVLIPILIPETAAEETI